MLVGVLGPRTPSSFIVYRCLHGLIYVLNLCVLFQIVNNNFTTGGFQNSIGGVVVILASSSSISSTS